ncbi:MAG: hypothetical protein P1U37_09695 [Minwuia sp.]|nr:hypothetical protein [Minwuia sp.]
MDRPRRSLWTDFLALTGAIGLSVLAVVFLFWLSAAPDDYSGRMIVRFGDKPPTQEAVQRIIASGATPVRAMPFISAWVVRADAGSVPVLKAQGAWLTIRDLGFDAAFAGCLGAASGPARAPFGPSGR